MGVQDVDLLVIVSRLRPSVEGSFFRGALIGLGLSLPFWALGIWALVRLVP